MKDALGHGSNSNRTDLPRNRISLTPGARFNAPSPLNSPRPLTTNGHVSDLRNRLATAQGPGHAHVLWQGIKNALGYTS